MRAALRCLVVAAIGLLLLLVYNEQHGGHTQVMIVDSASLPSLLAAYNPPALLELGAASPPPSLVSLSLWDSGLDSRYRALLRSGRHHDDDSRVDKRRHAAIGHMEVVARSNCSGHGQALSVRRGSDGGWARRCLCAPGWQGEVCGVREDSPCNTPEGGRVLTRCAGTCDNDVNRCLCGAGSRFPHRPMVHCGASPGGLRALDFLFEPV